MQILITGGGGFIGSHLVDHLLSATDADVKVLDDLSSGSPSNLSHVKRDRLTVRQGDVRDVGVVASATETADQIYHLAAAVGVKKIVEDPLDSLRTNLAGTENVLQAAASDGTPVFVASSSEVYGKPGGEPLSEEDDRTIGPTTVPRWGYATAKATDEFLALAYHDEQDFPVIIGRFFNVVGPRQTGQYGMVVPRFVEQALAGEPLTVYGDGSQTRSFTHVHDAVRLTHTLLEAPAAHGEVVNIGNPAPTSINELAERVIKLTDSDSKIRRIPFDEVYGEDFEEPSHREPDVRKLRNLAGWVPETDLDGILHDVIDERKHEESLVTND